VEGGEFYFRNRPRGNDRESRRFADS